MPSRAAEDLLTEAERAALDAICQAAGVPKDRWRDAPSIERPFLLLAWRRLSEELVETEGFGATRSHSLAASRLGVNLNTVQCWASRWARQVEESQKDRACA